MSGLRDGEPDGNGGRWCAGCGERHGVLYLCSEYSADVRAEIEGSSAALRDQLRDPVWVAEQEARGIPRYAIEVMGLFAGVRVGSGRPS